MALTKFIFLDPIILTEAQILAIYNNALALIAEGKTQMSWQGEGVSSDKAFVAPVMDILAEARYALKVKNPQKYGWITNRSKVIFA